MMLGALAQRHIGLANGCAELIELVLRIAQLAIDNPNAHDQRMNVDAGCLRNSIWHFDGRLSKCLQNALSIYTANALMLEQAFDC